MGVDPAVTEPSEADSRVVAATVVEELPNALFRLKLENQQLVLAHPVGTRQRNFVRLLPGDQVEVELSPHDWTRGRIRRRMAEK